MRLFSKIFGKPHRRIVVGSRTGKSKKFPLHLPKRTFFTVVGMLCGVFKDRYGNTAFDSVFFFLGLHMLSDYSADIIDEDMKLLSEVFRRRPDFNREVNEFALNAQPDYKNYGCVAPYLSLAHLYGWGYEPDVQEAEAFADKVAEMPKNSKETEWLRARIEAVKNGK